jgi:hypothetical protein
MDAISFYKAGCQTSSDAVDRYEQKDGLDELTCLSASMDAKPPECEASPPFFAMFWTSSLGRLAKFPGLLLSAIVDVGVVCLFVCLFFGWEYGGVVGSGDGDGDGEVCD